MRQCLVNLRPRSSINYTSRNRTLIATGTDGMISGRDHEGVYFHQTRIVSRLEYFFSDERFHCVAESNVDQDNWLGYYVITPREFRNETHKNLSKAGRDRENYVAEETQQVVELRISRFIADGIHEDLDFTNYTTGEIDFDFYVCLDADFADQGEVLTERRQWGKLKKSWKKSAGKSALTYDYVAEHHYKHQDESGFARFHRGVRLVFSGNDSPARYAGGAVHFKIKLGPQEKWHTCFNICPVKDGLIFEPKANCRSFRGTENDLDEIDRHYISESAEFFFESKEHLAEVVVRAADQARHDLMYMRLHDMDSADGGWTVAAGLPMYLALFGRDTLTTAWQTGMIDRAIMRGTLFELAKYQGKEFNDWRDEQPDKMMHEAHTGPLAELGFNPRSLYYGSTTTSAFYPFVVTELWHWTGDKELISKFIEPALKALNWVNRFGDIDGDGFYEYQTLSSQGLRNQSWKDSGDSMVHEDGTLAETPISTCEEQAFVYVSKLHFSELLWWLGRKDEARVLYREALELRKRFNEKFWMPDKNFFAMALDKDRRPLKSISSNPGHCLAAGIIETDLAEVTARRLMEPDLFSGWGIRTLSSDHPSFNPYSYHRGSVWPVENSTFSLGFTRYGFHGLAERLTRAQFEACSLFAYHRLPELFAGHQRDDDHPFPGMYPRANSPQAWSSTAVFSHIQSLLGLYPYAPLKMLIVDPHLPEWLPRLTLKRLTVGKAELDIEFYRKKNGESTYRVLDQRGTVHVLRQPSPWSMTATPRERLKDLFASF